MKKAQILQCPIGSAKRVIAHAKLQRSRGRQPSMPYLTEKNPRLALQLAMKIDQAHKQQNIRAKLEAMVPTRTFQEMSDAEFEIALKKIIRSSTTKEEMKAKAKEIGYPYGLSLNIDQPIDKVGHEAAEIVSALGGLTTKTGAMVMCMAHGPSGEIVSV
jgi:hypothetical protein